MKNRKIVIHILNDIQWQANWTCNGGADEA